MHDTRGQRAVGRGYLDCKWQLIQRLLNALNAFGGHILEPTHPIEVHGCQGQDHIRLAARHQPPVRGHDAQVGLWVVDGAGVEMVVEEQLVAQVFFSDVGLAAECVSPQDALGAVVGIMLAEFAPWRPATVLYTMYIMLS